MEKHFNILLVDDHQMMTDGLKSLLETQPDFKVVATARDEQEALHYCDNFTELDVIVMDINLSENGRNGLKLTEEIKKRPARIKILILSMHDESAYILQAKKVGADGFVSKNASGIDIVQAIRKLGDDIGEDSGTGLKAEGKGIRPPTETQMQVLKYIARGLTTAQIGRELAMPEATVSAHRHNVIQGRLGIKTQTDLSNFAIQCMRLFGTPPDPILTKVLENYQIEFKEKQNVNFEFEGETDGFNNHITQALCRVLEEVWNKIRHDKAAGDKLGGNILVRSERNSSTIKFTIRNDSTGDGVSLIKKERIGALKKILEAIGGTLTIADSDSTVIVTIPVRKTFNPIEPS
jgi:DNA-binding NarL/FixJ family response regulator